MSGEGGRTAVCIIDDDVAIRDALRLLLYSAGYATCGFESANHFLAEVDRQRQLFLKDEGVYTDLREGPECGAWPDDSTTRFLLMHSAFCVRLILRRYCFPPVR